MATCGRPRVYECVQTCLGVSFPAPVDTGARTLFVSVRAGVDGFQLMFCTLDDP